MSSTRQSERIRIWIGLLFAVLLILLALVSVGCVSAATTHYVIPGGSIQAAVTAANPGDTIIVHDGTYTENIDINKRLTIRSENGSANCFVNALDQNDHVFYVTADWVNISGFTVQNATDDWKAGIYLTNVDHCTISENTASNNIYGIGLYSSSDNILTGNTFSNNSRSIYLYDSSNNTLTSNTASNNYFGIWQWSSSNNNTITNNTVSNNTYGFRLGYSSNNTLMGNIVNSNSWYGFYLSFSSNNNTLTSNTASNNTYGIDLWSSSNNNLTGNTASNNTNRGFYLYSSSNNNTLTGNTANSNGAFGILIEESVYNRLTNNIISNNGNNGICLRRSSYNTLRNNSMSNNLFFNIVIRDTVTLEEWNNDIDDSNTANGLPVYYFYKQNNLVIDSYTTNKIGIVGCTNVKLRNINFSGGDPIAIVFTNDSLIENCTITNNNASGFVLLYSHNNSLVNSTASQNLIGLNIANSTHNSIRGNFFAGNAEYGIELSNCSNNLIYNNSFDNTQNAYDNGLNTWNISKTSGTNIIGGSWLGGNYWSDYTGSDTDGDGLGDTPYFIHEVGIDYLPLVAIVAPEIFDTGKGDYPSISGTHNGTIKPLYDIVNITTLYTYPSHSTGGHTEYVKIWNSTDWNETATWNGYTGDWHNLTFNNSFTLYANETYNYTIKTGSYPQIIHASSKEVTGGRITCEEFVDVNGKRHEGGIPAIRLAE